MRVRTATLAIATASSKRPAVISRWLRSSMAYRRSWRNRSRSISIQAAVQPGRMSAVSTVVSTAVSAGIVGRARIRLHGLGQVDLDVGGQRERAGRVVVEQPGYVDGVDGVGEEPLGGNPRPEVGGERGAGLRTVVHGQVGDQPSRIDAQSDGCPVHGEGESAQHRDAVRERLSRARSSLIVRHGRPVEELCSSIRPACDPPSPTKSVLRWTRLGKGLLRHTWRNLTA